MLQSNGQYLHAETNRIKPINKKDFMQKQKCKIFIVCHTQTQTYILSYHCI